MNKMNNAPNSTNAAHYSFHLPVNDGELYEQSNKGHFDDSAARRSCTLTLVTSPAAITALAQVAFASADIGCRRGKRLFGMTDPSSSMAAAKCLGLSSGSPSIDASCRALKNTRQIGNGGRGAVDCERDGKK